MKIVFVPLLRNTWDRDSSYNSQQLELDGVEGFFSDNWGEEFYIVHSGDNISIDEQEVYAIRSVLS